MSADVRPQISTAQHQEEVLGLFSFRRPTLSHDELRDRFLEAVAASNTRLVKKLAAGHLELTIVQESKSRFLR